MRTSLIHSADPSGPPLCRSYVAVLFNPISVQILPVGGAAAADSEPTLWALGVLADGMPDYLGSWQYSGPKVPRWLAVVDDLQTGGVERIRVVIGPDAADIQAAMAAWHQSCNRNSECTVLPASGLTVESAQIEALPPGHRTCIERAQEVAIPLGRYLGRAVARHGSFADPAAAKALLHLSAERYIRANWPEAPEVFPSFASSRTAPAARRRLLAAA